MSARFRPVFTLVDFPAILSLNLEDPMADWAVLSASTTPFQATQQPVAPPAQALGHQPPDKWFETEPKTRLRFFKGFKLN
jgi:hypothetical protein